MKTDALHVTINGDTPKVKPLPAHDIELREQIRRYILEHSEPWHREHLGRLERLWEQWNAEHFGAEMVIAAIVLSEPSTPRALGQCAAVSGIGCRSEISIRPSLLTGKHPMVRAGDKYAEGRSLLVADVLLHEMVHQWQQEVTGETEDSYHGHGPTFRDKANEIGTKLGLPKVRTCQRRGKDKDLPSCSQWPHNVRPGGFYLGAVVTASSDKPAMCEAAANSLARRFTAEEIRTIAEMALRAKGGA